MGLKSDFYRNFIGRSTERVHNSERDVGVGSIVGVDISIPFHQIMSHSSVIREYHTSPRVPAYHFLSEFKDLHQSLCRLGLTPLYVFDGSRHPVKHAEDTNRRARAIVARQHLKELYAREDPNDLKEIEKERGKCVKLENDMIALVIEYLRRMEGAMYLQAPFEAEWQLVWLQLNGYIDWILSQDGDVFPLGSTRWITNLNLDSGDCNIIITEEALKREALGGGKWNEYRNVLPIFCGCDYIDKLYGVQPGMLMEGYIAANNKGEYLRSLERNNRWPPSVEPDRTKTGALGYAWLAEKVVVLFKKAPVWQLFPAKQDGIDMSDHSTFMVKLCPLDGSKHDSTGETGWGEAIGFTKSPIEYLEESTGVQRHEFVKLAAFEIWARDGNPLKQLTYPTFTDRTTGESYKVPHGGVIDTAAIPLVHQDDSALFRFVNAHLPEVPASWHRRRHLKLAKQLVHVLRENPATAPRPLPIQDRQFSCHGSWQSINEMFEPLEGSNALKWSGVAVAMERIRKVMNINDSSIDRIIGKGRNGVRNRAVARVVGGHINPSSLSSTLARRRHDGMPISIFRMLVTPSQKARDYLVYHCYGPDGKFLPSPFSRCECPAGRLPHCSHSMAELAVESLIQSHSEWDENDFRQAMPPPIKTLKNTPVPWEMCFGEDEASKVARKLANVRSVSCTHNDKGESEDDCEEDEDSEIDLFLFPDDEPMTPTVRICESAENMVQLARARSQFRNGNARAAYEHKVCIQEIRAANKRRLDDIGGPNECLESKLEQVEYIIRVRDLVDGDELPRSMLSHYGEYSKHALLRWKAQLETAIQLKAEGDDTVQVHWPAMRLEKAPSGSSVLADKAFAPCHISYPKFNRQLTPTFLSKRDQFDEEDLIRDEPLKKRRWGSEANFRRIDEVDVLRDRVPRTNFSHLHKALDWAHGRQNLVGKPFYYPDDDYFHAEKERARESREAKKRRKRERDKSCNAADSGRAKKARSTDVD